MKDFKDVFAEICDDMKHIKPNENDSQNDFLVLKEKSKTMPVFTYGAGVGLLGLYPFMRGLGIEISGICDSFRTGLFKDKYPIINPNELRQKHPDALVVIAAPRFEGEIRESLLALGFCNEQIIDFPKVQPKAPNPLSLETFMDLHYSGYEGVYNALKDDESRRVLAGRVRAYLASEPTSASSDCAQYFNREIIRLAPDEVFIDAGAFLGETAQEFVRECDKAGVDYRRIYSFEPNPMTFEDAKTVVCFLKNTEIINKGLWSEETELTFVSADNPSSSAIEAASQRTGNKTVVSCISLDEFFKEKTLEDLPTFIKMDIEGAEQEALKGAKEIIAKKSPKMAICVYHRPDDPYRVYEIINEYNANYDFYYRQEIEGFGETVLYCIPK
ncbi:MAG: FkbM family methyltransferase [Defluviitaleaceae bacterium]|nr:FkbM family methyltransferase [Defluviitaleaceae bacterium]